MPECGVVEVKPAGDDAWLTAKGDQVSRYWGRYQVLKKWLSYRERDILGRALKPEEVQYFADTARRIGAISTG